MRAGAVIRLNTVCIVKKKYITEKPGEARVAVIVPGGGLVVVVIAGGDGLEAVVRFVVIGRVLLVVGLCKPGGSGRVSAVVHGSECGGAPLRCTPAWVLELR